MDLTIGRFFSIFQMFCLFASVRSAPTGHDDSCAALSQSVLHFNQVAQEVAKSGLKGIIEENISVAWMEAQDMCDPGTLRHTPEPCMKKMLDVLTSYKSIVKTITELQSCPHTHKVKPVLQKLHEDMSRCVRSRMEYHPHKANHISETELQSMDLARMKLLCQYTMDRLFSFSILTARVFSVGDPSEHDEPTATNCAQRN